MCNYICVDPNQTKKYEDFFSLYRENSFMVLEVGITISKSFKKGKVQYKKSKKKLKKIPIGISSIVMVAKFLNTKMVSCDFCIKDVNITTFHTYRSYKNILNNYHGTDKYFFLQELLAQINKSRKLNLDISSEQVLQGTMALFCEQALEIYQVDCKAYGRANSPKPVGFRKHLAGVVQKYPNKAAA